MLAHRLQAWLRHVPLLAAAAGLLTLAGCGGGGGSPSNAFTPSPSAPPSVVILPAIANVYSGVPSSLQITSGTPPFTAFSSNSAVLPVASSVGTTIALLPNQVAVEEAVRITVQDALGQRGSADITVKPSLLLPASITVTGNPNCAASTATLCSGQDGSATVKVSGPAGAPLPGRQIRYDVIQGDFALVSTNPGTPLVQTLTVVTDQNGNAAITLRVPNTASTQYGTLRATDVTSGSAVVAQFTIAQYVNGNSVLSVIPSGQTTFTGPDDKTCSAGALASWYVFGGTPPYTIQTNFPTAVALVGVPVLASGGGFSVVTNGTCFTGLTFAITDANGRVLISSPLASNVVGTNPAPTLPALSISPQTQTATNCTGAGRTFQLQVVGGTGSYVASASPSGAALSTNNPVQGTPFSVTITGGPGTYTVTVTSAAVSANATITCT